MGYDSFVQEKLAGRAEVFFAEDNGRFVQYTLRTLSNWAAKNQWSSDIDVVHWNNVRFLFKHTLLSGYAVLYGENSIGMSLP